MIQDIGENYIYHNEYRPDLDSAGPQEDDYVMFVSGRKVLSKVLDGCIEYPRYKDTKDIKDIEYRYLFAIDIEGKPRYFYLGCTGKTEIEIAGYTYEQQNIFRRVGPRYMAFAGITACQLANWYHGTRYCGRCGSKLIHDSKERMMRCPGCNAMHYPRISPAVIVAVTNGDKILLTKYAGRDYTKYALIAGFTEIGESVEDTVRREVMEEVGLKVKNIRYYKSQPWSFTDTVLMGYFCEVDGDDAIRIDEDELSVGEWVDRQDVPDEHEGISLTEEMMLLFRSKEDEQF